VIDILIIGLLPHNLSGFMKCESYANFTDTRHGTTDERAGDEPDMVNEY